jgi:hypothetical protein
MHTTVVNIGSAKVFDVRLLRTLDPDQEQPWSASYASFATNNYVKYQNQSSYAGMATWWSPVGLVDAHAQPPSFPLPLATCERCPCFSVDLLYPQQTSLTGPIPCTLLRFKWLLRVRATT